MCYYKKEGVLLQERGCVVTRKRVCYYKKEGVLLQERRCVIT